YNEAAARCDSRGRVAITDPAIPAGFGNRDGHIAGPGLPQEIGGLVVRRRSRRNGVCFDIDDPVLERILAPAASGEEHQHTQRQGQFVETGRQRESRLDRNVSLSSNLTAPCVRNKALVRRSRNCGKLATYRPNPGSDFRWETLPWNPVVLPIPRCHKFLRKWREQPRK